MIYHITHSETWKKAQKIGQYLPEGFEGDGFIHCSKKEQLPEVVKNYYAGQSGLTLLSINPAKLTARLEYENLIGGQELYPHIYGPLPVNAVESVAEFDSNEVGDFKFPELWTPNDDQ